MSAAKPIDIKKSVVDTILAGLISLVVFGPIVGVVLEDALHHILVGGVVELLGIDGGFFVEIVPPYAKMSRNGRYASMWALQQSDGAA